MDKVLCTMIFVYLLFKKKKKKHKEGAALNIASYMKNDKGTGLRSSAAAISSILGVFFFPKKRKNIHLQVNGLV